MTRNQWDWKTAGAALAAALFTLMLLSASDIFDAIRELME